MSTLKKTYGISRGEKSVALCIFCLHGSEASDAGVECGGVHCGHGAAVLDTRGAVIEEGDGVSSGRVAEKESCLSRSNLAGILY